MSNPDFSMVTVQCEDSGIHWETTSSRCSTPWASEASTTSDIYSMESSSVGTPSGKVIFIMDEGKMRRKRVRPSSSSKFTRLSPHHKKSGENPKESADSMEESFKHALEKAKRHLSTHTEEANTTDSPAKPPDDITSQNQEEPPKDSTSQNQEEPPKDSTSQNPEEPPKDSTSQNPEEPPKDSTSQNPEEPHKDSTSQNQDEPPKDSTSQNPEETPKYSTSENTEEPPETSTSQNPEKPPKDSTSQYTEEPKSDLGSEKTTQDEKVEPTPAEATAVPPSNPAEKTQSDKVSEKTVKPTELSHDNAGSAAVKNVAQKKTSEDANDDFFSNARFKGRIPQSLVHAKPDVLSSKHDIDYPPNVLVELSSVLENIAKLTNPQQGGLSQVEEPPSTESNVFSIVSDGSEILNILAPDLISTADQDASEEMQDKLEYLEENPLLKPKQFLDLEEPWEFDQKDSETVEEEKIENRNTPTDKAANEIDYFEKFTLIDTCNKPADVNVQTPALRHELVHVTEEQSSASVERQPSIEEDYYVLHSLDESFYGVSLDKDGSRRGSLLPETSSLEALERQEKKKTNGATLFSPDEGVLEKSFFFPTSYPINPELLEEPPALAFLYTDLYEQARGCKAKEEHDKSDAESTSSAATFHSRISDDDGTGIYFEKFNLKDEIPPGAVKSDDEEEFYSDEGSEEEQYLSYEVLANESFPENNNLGSGTKKSEEDVPSAFSKVPRKEASDVEPLPLLAREIRSKVISRESIVNKQNVDLIEKEVPKPHIMKQKCVADEDEIDESLDYVIVSPDDLEEDDVSLKEITFDDQEPEEHENVSYLETVQEVPQKHDYSGFEIVKRDKEPEEVAKKLSEPPQAEDKQDQMDSYCNSCKIPIVANDKDFGDHKNHDVITLEDAVNSMTSNLEALLETLQASSLKTEDFVTRVEALFNEVEKNCAEAEKHLAEENEKMVEKVIAQHKEKRESHQEVKKMKMDYLYDQMVSFQQNVDAGKEILEKTAKEVEELDALAFLSAHSDISSRVITAIENTLSLDKMPSAFSLFDHLAAKTAAGDQKAARHVPVPQTPKLKPQEANSATSASITVYWTMSEEDIIDCFQVYCMEEPQGNRDENGLLEEYRVIVKESFCILEDLEADKCYSVWVMAVNNTGCSLPSDKSIFRTAPSTPLIKAEECTVCWNTAVIRWSTAHPESTETFTLEWCKQYSSEGEGLRSVSGIKDQQLRVSLQPGENYFFYVKAANTFGSSEQSEAALISTKGTRFHLLRDTAHPALDLSPDGAVISISEQKEITGIPLVLGELLPAAGRHYWEMLVNECSAYSVGATFRPSPEEYASAQDSTSWCMQCSCSSTSFSYKFLHNELWSEVLLTAPPLQVGILLDYGKGRLSFYDVQRKQLLFTFRYKFTEAAHPTFALEAPGEIHLHTGIELPNFAKHS
ncbi:cardiomyopathy-associated protein 5 isoform X2 [Hyperolius riggenbachi]